MNSMWKRSFALLLSLVMVFGMVPVNAFAEDSAAVVCDGTAECQAVADHAEDCLKAIADAEAAAKAANEPAVCNKQEDCPAAQEHAEDCMKAIAAAKAAEEAAKAASEPAVVVCSGNDTCVADTHNAECPMGPCTLTEGCELAKSHVDQGVPCTGMDSYEETVNMVSVTSADGTATVEYATLQEALEKVTSKGTITLLEDITFDGTWTFKSYVTINGNGKTLKLSGNADGAVFHFNSTPTIKNLTIDMTEAQYGHAFSTNSSVTVDNCVFNGNPALADSRAIVFAKTSESATVKVTGSQFTNWTGALSNAVNKDAKNVTITGSSFDNAAVNVAALTSATITGNTFANTSLKVSTYAADVVLKATVADNTFTNATAQIEKGDLIKAQQEVTLPDGYKKVASIDGYGYPSLQAAIDTIKGSKTILLETDVEENIVLTEIAKARITIDGNGKTMKGSITVKALPETDSSRRITIRNVNFVSDQEIDFIRSKENNRYPQLTVRDCTFTGNGTDDIVGIRLKSSNNVTIQDCTGTGLHSLLQNEEGWNLTVKNVTVTDSKGGLALGTVRGVTVDTCNLSTSGYGIRLDAGYDNNAVIEDCTVNAFIPVVVRNTQADSTITVKGINTMTGTNTDGLWLAIGNSEYKENGSLPSAATTQVLVLLKDRALDEYGIYGFKVYSLEGEGTSKSPYKIYTRADLEYIRDQVAGGNSYAGVYFRMYADIDLKNKEWTPIGKEGAPFEGIFDGYNKTVSNLKITGSANNAGFFGFTKNGQVKKLTIHNASVSGGLNVGVAAGASHTTEYSTITVSGDVQVNGVTYVGGVLGKYVNADLTGITVNTNPGSYVKADSGSSCSYAGGVVGSVGEGSVEVENVHSNIDVIGTGCGVGGITGIANYGNTFTNCSSSGNVTNTTEDAETVLETGGIAGVWHNEAGHTVTFTDCSYTGTLSAPNAGSVTFPNGGLVGAAYAVKNDTFENSGKLMINGSLEWPAAPVEIGSRGYLTLADAVKAVQDGETILLKDNITTEKSVSLTKNITLDLNGKTIESVASPVLSLKEGAKLIITDTTADKDGKILTTGKNALYVYGTLELKAGTLKALERSVIVYTNGSFNMDAGKLDGPVDGIRMFGKNTFFTMNGGEILGGISGYGSEEEDGTPKYGPTTITINGGTITDNADGGMGISHPQAGTLVINGGTVTGTAAGVQMRRGSLEIKGGDIKATAEDGKAVSVYFSTVKPTTVAISGGTMEGAYAFHEIYTKSTIPTDVTLSITGGTFKGNVESENFTCFIQDGIFSADPTPYLQIHRVAAQKDGIWTVSDRKVETVPPTVSMDENIDLDQVSAELKKEIFGEDASAPAAKVEVKDDLSGKVDAMAAAQTALDEVRKTDPNAYVIDVQSTIGYEITGIQEVDGKVAVTFDVNPLVITTVMTEDGEEKIETEVKLEAAKTYTFQLPIFNVDGATHAQVTHQCDTHATTHDLGKLPIVKNAEGQNVVVIETECFSPFTGRALNPKDVACKIDDMPYESLTEALEKVQNGETITLTNPMNIDAQLVIDNGKTFTLDGADLTVKALPDADGDKYGYNSNHMISVNSGNVSVKNLVLDTAGNAGGIQFYASAGSLTNVSILNIAKFGAVQANMAELTVNGKLKVTGGNADSSWWTAIALGNSDGTKSTVFTAAPGASFEGVSYVYADAADANAAKCTMIVPENCGLTVVADAKIGNTYYPTLAAAVANAGSDATIQVQKNLEEKETFVINSAITLDINGYNPTVNAFNVTNGGKLTLKNSKENVAPSGINTTVIVAGGTFNLESGSILAEANALTLESGTANIKGRISSNGLAVCVKGGTLNVKGEIYGKPAVYQTAGQVNITSGVVRGDTGLYVRGGEVTVSGTATVSGFGEKKAFVAAANGTPVATGDAMVVENSGTNAPAISITGGTFESLNNAPVASYGDNAVAGFVKGGTHKGKSVEESVLHENFEYVKKDANVYEVKEKPYVVVDGEKQHYASGTETLEVSGAASVGSPEHKTVVTVNNGADITIEPTGAKTFAPAYLVEKGWAYAVVTTTDANNRTTTTHYFLDNGGAITVGKDGKVTVTGEYITGKLENGQIVPDYTLGFTQNDLYDSTHYRGKDPDMVITCNGFFGSIDKIEIIREDIGYSQMVYEKGAAVSGFTVVKGSTKVTLPKAYLNGLSQGEYEIHFLYRDGVTEIGTFKVVKVVKTDSGSGGTPDRTNPKTGDTIFVPAFVMISTAAALAVLVIGKKRA